MGGISAHHQNNPGKNDWQSIDACDLGVPVGTEVYAISDGVISPSGTEYSGFGPLNSSNPKMAGLRFTLVTNGNAFYYTHNSTLLVRPNQRVRAGQLIAKSGEANGAAHLHIASEQGNIENILRASKMKTGPRR
jgi:murein DD-endopeptidase MepM/ murein hydrolase activator NlpD